MMTVKGGNFVGKRMLYTLATMTGTAVGVGASAVGLLRHQAGALRKAFDEDAQRTYSTFAEAVAPPRNYDDEDSAALAIIGDSWLCGIDVDDPAQAPRISSPVAWAASSERLSGSNRRRDHRPCPRTCRAKSMRSCAPPGSHVSCLSPGPRSDDSQSSPSAPATSSTRSTAPSAFPCSPRRSIDSSERAGTPSSSWSAPTSAVFQVCATLSRPHCGEHRVCLPAHSGWRLFQLALPRCGPPVR